MIVALCSEKSNIKPVHIEPRIAEVKRLIADATRAKELLGWEPKYDFKTGLKAFVEWYRSYGFEERFKLE